MKLPKGEIIRILIGKSRDPKDGVWEIEINEFSFKWGSLLQIFKEVPWSVICSGSSEREVGSGLSEQEVHGANHCRKILRGSRGSWLQIFYAIT